MKASFRCFYKEGRYSQHYQDLNIRDLHLWVLAYRFTHPNVKAITIQLKFDEEGKPDVPLHGEERENRETGNHFER